jgi:hypothetical protein
MTDDIDFGAEEAALLGGVIGFAEESLREENRLPDDSDPDIEPSNDGDVNLRLFRNGHPDLYKHIVKTVIRQRLRWQNESAAMQENADEIAAMNRCESMAKKSQKDE